MQISSPSQTSTASSLSIASRPVAGQDAVETRSVVMPAVQHEATVNRQNPANRPTLVDEKVRLYGPFNNANAAATVADAVVDPAASRIVVDDQSQNQQSQQGREEEPQSASDSDAAEASAPDVVKGERASDSATRNGAEQSPARASATADADRKANAAREVRIEKAEQQQISKLSARDREVRAHEAAHSSIGGQYAGGASFTLKQGPNGVSYAIGGEVPIDLSAIPDDPAATVRKMQTVQRAALAPAEPSSADRAVAAQAGQIAQQARAQIQSEQAGERASKVENARQQRAEAAEKRAQISERLTDLQNNFNFSNELAGAQRSRQISIVAESYSPLRPGTIGTLFDERV